MQIYACDNCETPLGEKDLTRFGQGYELDVKQRVLKQKVQVTITFQKLCGEYGELCDPCATKILKEAVTGSWWDWSKKK